MLDREHSYQKEKTNPSLSLLEPNLISKFYIK